MKDLFCVENIKTQTVSLFELVYIVTALLKNVVEAF